MGDLLQGIENFLFADITGMKDQVRAAQGVERFLAEEAVGVRDKTDELEVVRQSWIGPNLLLNSFWGSGVRVDRRGGEADRGFEESDSGIVVVVGGGADGSLGDVFVVEGDGEMVGAKRA